MALYRLDDKELVQHYGVALINEEGKILMFQEKPRVEEAFSNLVSTAIYHLSGEFLRKLLPDYLIQVMGRGKRPDRIGDLWEYVVKRFPIYGHVFSGAWSDVGSPETYIKANNKVLKSIGREVKTSEIAATARLKGDNIMIGGGVEVGDDTTIHGPAMVGDGCLIGERCAIGPYAVLAHDCEIGRGSEIRGSISFERVNIGRDSVITDSIIDGSVRVGDGCSISDESVIGYKATLGDRVKVEGSKIWPFTEVRGKRSIRGDLVAQMDDEMKRELSESCYWL